MWLRAITIAALGMLTVSALLWALSLPAITYREPRSMVFVTDLRGGILTVHNGGSYTRPGWQLGPRTRLNWWPHDGDFVEWYPLQGGRAAYRFTLPLWIPALISAAVLITARGIRRQPPYACSSCGYSRAGLGASVPCPECGAVGASTPGIPA